MCVQYVWFVRKRARDETIKNLSHRVESSGMNAFGLSMRRLPFLIAEVLRKVIILWIDSGQRTATLLNCRSLWNG